MKKLIKITLVAAVGMAFCLSASAQNGKAAGQATGTAVVPEKTVAPKPVSKAVEMKAGNTQPMQIDSSVPASAPANSVNQEKTAPKGKQTKPQLAKGVRATQVESKKKAPAAQTVKKVK